MEPQHTTNWSYGLLALGLGTLAAIIYVAMSAKKLEPAPQTDDDYTARYNGLLAELKELIANKHLMNDAQFAAEKTRLETAAAAALRERDQVKHERLKKEARAEKAPVQSSQSAALKGALVGGVVVAFFGFLGFQLSQTSAPRQDGMPVTGGAPPGGAPMQQAPQPDAKLDAAIAAAKANPNDVDAQAAAGLALMRKQRFEEAMPFIDQATMIDPYHVRTRVGRAVTLAFDGNLGAAQNALEALAAKYPEAYEGRLFAGMMAMEQQDTRRAINDFEAYIAAAGPEAPPMMRAAVEQLKRQGAGPPQ